MTNLDDNPNSDGRSPGLFDGCREALGVLAMITYVLLGAQFFFEIAREKENSSGSLFAAIEAASLAFVEICMLISFCVCILCFRPYKRFIKVFLLLHLAFFLLALVYGIIVLVPA